MSEALKNRCRAWCFNLRPAETKGISRCYTAMPSPYLELHTAVCTFQNQWVALGAVLALKICAQIFLFTHFLGGSTFPGKLSHISFVFTQIVVGVIWVP
jgi:hypothetical protein